MSIPADVQVLVWAAISIGFFHTLFGPDHYVPFVAMSQVGRWSWRKTILVTVLCGFGHVGSSILLGFVGIALGIVLVKLEAIESVRGDWAGWALLAFGLVYFVWGLIHARRHALGEPHHHGPGLLAFFNPAKKSASDSESPSVAVPEQAENRERQEPAPRRASRMTPWALAVIFVLGPCEPLIPLLMYPAAKENTWAALLVAFMFGLVTLVTMTAAVIAMRLGINSIRLGSLHAYSHALAGFAVFASGLAIQLGL